MTRPVVVGGVTTGCITALRLADAGRTVVLLDGSAALGGIVREATTTRAPWTPGARVELAALEPHRRHPLLTARDVRRLRALEARMRVAGGVPGAWVAYGREQKLDAIAADARALGLLPEAVPARAA